MQSFRNRDPARAERQAPIALTKEWPQVHVERVDLSVERADGGTHRACVRCCIDLGDRLVPADVCVEVLSAKIEGAPPVRLWSTRSYRNGSYLFEAHAPADALVAASVTVRVTPSAVEPGLVPVVTEVPWPDDARASA